MSVFSLFVSLRRYLARVGGMDEAGRLTGSIGKYTSMEHCPFPREG